MLALADFRASRCSGCGQNVHETTAKQGTHQWKARVWRCLACDALEAAQQKVSHKPEDRPSARRWLVEKVG